MALASLDLRLSWCLLFFFFFFFLPQRMKQTLEMADHHPKDHRQSHFSHRAPRQP